MVTKRRAVLILAVALLLGALSALAEGEVPGDARSGEFGDGFSWVLADDGTLTVSGSGDMPRMWSGSQPWRDVKAQVKAVVIGAGVTRVGDYAFYQYPALTAVTIGPDVTAIGSSAFDLCRAMTSLSLGGAVASIEDSAFDNCDALRSVAFPSAVEKIGFRAFNACDSLESLSLNSGLKTLESNAFADCESLKQLTLPGTLEKVSEEAFQDCTALQSVVLQEGLTEIDDSAFSGCTALKRVALPKSLKRVGEDAFTRCTALTGVEYGGTSADWYRVQLEPGNVPLVKGIKVDVPVHGACGDHLTWSLSRKGVLTIQGKGDMWDYQEDKDVYKTGGITVRGTSPWQVYEDMITALKIKSGVTGIGAYAFTWLQYVGTADIPDTVTRIGEYALYGIGVSTLKLPSKLKKLSGHVLGCTENLMDLKIPNGVQKIEHAAFWDSALRSITIPASVTKIEDYAFDSCDGLTYVRYTGTNSKWRGVSVGVRNDPMKRAEMSYGAEKRSGTRSGKCGKKVRWKLDAKGVLTISGSGAMNDYPIAFQEGDYAEEWNGYCRRYAATTPWEKYLGQIKKIVVKKGVTRIGDGAFFNCYSATAVSLPKTLTSIGNDAFRSMTISSISIPDSVETIGAGCFRGCFRITKLHLPKRLRSVPQYCFAKCQALTKLVLPGHVTFVDNLAFMQAGIEDLTYPASVKQVRNDIGLSSGLEMKLRFGGARPDGMTQEHLKQRDIYCTAKYYADYRDYLLPPLLKIDPGSYTGGEYFGTISTGDTPAVLSAKSITLTEEKRSVTLTASVGGVTKGLSVKWHSSDSKKVAVSRKGKVTAKAFSGGALIYAEVKYKGATTLVFCPVSIRYEKQDQMLFGMLPAKGIKPNYLATCSLIYKDQNGYDCYQPAMYVETDKSNRYYKELAALTKQLTAGCATDEQKARKILGWVDQNVKYSLSSLCIGETPSQVYYVYTVREGNCQGFSKLAGFMLSLANIPCGTVANDGHMWNIAWIDGKWMLLDAQLGEDAFNHGYFSDALYKDIQRIVFAQGDSIYIIDQAGQIVQAGVGVNSVEEGRSGVTSVTIPEYVTSIRGGSFQFCKNLTKVTIPATVKTIADDAFEGCDKLTIYCYKNSVAHAYAKKHKIPFKLLKGTGKVQAPPMALVLPPAMTEIESEAFANLKSAEAIVIPASVTAIADDAFAGTDAVLVVVEGSYAQTWAMEHGFTYVTQ